MATTDPQQELHVRRCRQVVDYIAELFGESGHEPPRGDRAVFHAQFALALLDQLCDGDNDKLRDLVDGLLEVPVTGIA